MNNVALPFALALLSCSACTVNKGNLPRDPKTGQALEDYRRLEERPNYSMECRGEAVYTTRSADGAKHSECMPGGHRP